MQRLIFLFLVLFFCAGVLPVYPLTVLSGPDTDGCYNLRIEGDDIIYDVSTFSDLYISRDGGESWLVIFKDDEKAINWLAAKGKMAISAISLPSGNYNAVKFRSHRIIRADLEDRPERPKREVEFDLGDELDFTTEYIDMTIVKNSNLALKIDNPLVYLDLRVKWDTNINAYANPQIIDQVFKKDITGHIFSVEPFSPEQKEEKPTKKRPPKKRIVN